MYKRKIPITVVLLTIFCILLSYSSFAGGLKQSDKVIIGGRNFGVEVTAKGLIISGIEDVATAEGDISPGKKCGLNNGDIIIKINGNDAIDISSLYNTVMKSNGNEISLELMREDRIFNTTIKPVLSISENVYRLGLWCTNTTSGIGTVTYYDKNNGIFAGLGHGICTTNSTLIPLSSSVIKDCLISEIIKGSSIKPGELHGSFIGNEKGKLIANTVCGVYGVIDTDNIKGEEIEIADKSEVTTGKAEIINYLNSDYPEKYSVKIESIENRDSQTRNMVVRITDNRLLEQTGGIVQGMSGTPIIQNNKLIGAITHVIVEDQTTGYAIFIQNMTDNSPI